MLYNLREGKLSAVNNVISKHSFSLARESFFSFKVLSYFLIILQCKNVVVVWYLYIESCFVV
jgi:hypothetical protein